MRLRNEMSATTRLSLALFLLTAVSFGGTLVEASTLKVPSKYATIQEAIDAASAGDSIKIDAAPRGRLLKISLSIRSCGFVGSRRPALLRLMVVSRR